MTNTGFAGVQNSTFGQGSFNEQHFAMRQAMSGINSSTVVQVVAVTNSGGLSPVGFVDVHPLVNQLDGAQQAMPHDELYHLPYFRLQGGSNAVIIDPQIGDLGIVVFADRDISSVKATKAQANPGSGRRFDMADGIYIGGILNGTPVQYVQFGLTGITVTSPSKITINAPDVEINGTTLINGATTINGSLSQGAGPAGGAATMLGPVTVTNDVTAGGKSMESHTHNGVQPGNGNSGTPN